MVVALKDIKIRGEIRSIVDYAVDMIQHPDFVGNSIHTTWLDNRIATNVSLLGTSLSGLLGSHSALSKRSLLSSRGSWHPSHSSYHTELLCQAGSVPS